VPLYQIVSPAALRSAGSATAYPLSWFGLVVLVRGRTSRPEAGGLQEVVFVAGGVGGGADQPPELVAGHFLAVLAGGLVQLGGRGQRWAAVDAM